MTPNELRECLNMLCWSQRGLARRLGRQEGTVRQWARGIVQIPLDVEVWIENLTRHYINNPAPKRASDQNEGI